MMRNLRLMIVLLVLSFVSASAVLAHPTFDPRGPNPARLGPNKIYACPKCEMASTKSGTCKMCKGALEEIHGKFVYTCAKDKTTADKAGNCPKCGKFMAKAVQTYACTKCHTTGDKPGNCPKCGKFMSKKTLPMMK